MNTNSITPEDSPATPSRRGFLDAAVGGAAGLAAGLAGGVALASSTAPKAPVVIEGLRRFDGKVVLVTGATSGIGRAAAEAFAREGAKVAFCGRREQLGKQIETRIRENGGDAHFIRADVRDEEQVERMTAETLRRYGGLDIALNNAGTSFNKLLHETTAAEWDDLQAINVRGVFLSMKAQIRSMLARGGQILVTASVNAFGARPELGAYNASKRALTGLVQTAALEYAERGIRVNAVCPGATDTEMVRRQAGMMNVPDAVWRAAVGTWARSNVHGLRRVAEAEEIATTILAMASPEMAYMTGSMLVVDGGMMAAL